MLRTYVGRVSGGCGVLNFYSFFRSSINSSSHYNIKKQLKKELASKYFPHGGLAIAYFVNDLICKEAYTNFTNMFPILFQSKVHRNKNTGNRAFFVVFNIREDVK